MLFFIAKPRKTSPTFWSIYWGPLLQFCHSKLSRASVYYCLVPDRRVPYVKRVLALKREIIISLRQHFVVFLGGIWLVTGL